MAISVNPSQRFSISPKGHLCLDGIPSEMPATSASLLFHLARQKPEGPVAPDEAYWRGLANRYMSMFCQSINPTLGVRAPKEWLTGYLGDLPPMKGGEYVTLDVLTSLWNELNALITGEAAKFPGALQAWIHRINPEWNVMGRVTFHLAENKKNPEKPFAFIATYTHRLSDQDNPQYIPLGNALKEYANDKAALIALLSPVQIAAKKSELIAKLVASDRLYHAQQWSAAQAYKFLKDVEIFKESGILVRLPDWWKSGKSKRPSVRVTVGNCEPSRLGIGALLSFSANLTIDGEELSPEEWEKLKSSTDGLVFLRGQWVESDPEKLQEVMTHWKAVAAARKEGISFTEAFRMLSGLSQGKAIAEEESEDVHQWSVIEGGEWITKQLESLRSPDAANESIPHGDAFTLRPYQREGTHWLRFIARLGLGACLADDMGLGKTLQTIAALLHWRKENPASSPALLVAPATLLANWDAEIKNFAPSLKFKIAHPSELSSKVMKDPVALKSALDGCDLVATSYGMISREATLREFDWSRIILDEAQNIKNPGTRQSKAVKSIKATDRLALTGTPLENSLGDLWSLFDFLNPGLLGSASEFTAFTRKLYKSEDPERFAPLRRLVQPFILRRLKTDKAIAAELPAKTETIAYCSLTKRQAAIYEETVESLAKKLEVAEKKNRGGLILSHLMQFKQICNHPAHFAGTGAYAPDESGKFERLKEIAEEISSRQEKVLVFTQFREMTNPIHDFLAGVFGRPGLILHGDVDVGDRHPLVDKFQKEDGPPFFVLSVKAGGTGLTLTEASQVIHFDRWWNPAVENQATDRVFRIGQKKNVIVHKFVCRGTIEERIDELISSKLALSEDILSTGEELPLTSMSDSDLIAFVSLDPKKAMAES